MTDKTAFSPEEWAGIKTLPGAVSMYIITASPAVGDSMKESFALAKNLADPKPEGECGGAAEGGAGRVHRFEQRQGVAAEV